MDGCKVYGKDWEGRGGGGIALYASEHLTVWSLMVVFTGKNHGQDQQGRYRGESVL